MYSCPLQTQFNWLSDRGSQQVPTSQPKAGFSQQKVASSLQKPIFSSVITLCPIFSSPLPNFVSHRNCHCRCDSKNWPQAEWREDENKILEVGLGVSAYNLILFNFAGMPKQFMIEMSERYPFGQLGETLTEDTRAMVKKTLHFDNSEEYEMIKQMIHFLRAARHDNLVNIEKVLEGEQAIELHYEYAPFRLEKWVVAVNEELINSLEDQLYELVEYLTRSSIKFDFDPDSIGLSKDMTIKYFLNEFSIDLENQEDNLKMLQSEIRAFFLQLCGESYAEKEPRESVESYKCPRLESMSTNGSISPMDELLSLNASMASIKIKNQESDKPKTKSGVLSQKVEDSMKKSMEVLLRFKKMSQK